MIRAALIGGLAGLGLFSTACQAIETGGAVRVSTQGFGGELAVNLIKPVNLRVGGYGFTAEFNAEIEEVDFTIDLDLVSAGGYLDFHPFVNSFAKGFRVTGGLLYNANGVSGQAVDNISFTIGDLTFTEDEVGTLDTAIDFNNFSPYAGIGWGNYTIGESRYFFTMDLGVMFHGTPQFSLTSTGGTLSNDAILLDEIDEEVAEVQEDIDQFRVYPVVSFGIGVRF